MVLAIYLPLYAVYAQETAVDTEEDVPEMADYEVDATTDRPNVKYGTNTRYTKKTTETNYEYQLIVDDYKLKIYRIDGGYKRLYGLVKGERQLLPVVFSYNSTIRDNSKVILGIGNKYGIYNFRSEKWDAPIAYSSIAYMSKDLYVATLGNRKGIIDSYGKILVGFDWSSISPINGLDNYLIVRDFNRPIPKSGIYSVLNKRLVVKSEYTTIIKLKTDNLFIVKNESNKHNIVDVHGREQLANWYDGLVAEQGGRSRYIVTQNGKTGIIDGAEKIIVPLTYRSISTTPYSDGSYLAENNDGKFGFMTIDGDVTLPFIYDNLEFQNYTGLGISSTNDKCGVIKVNNGKPYELATCEYDNITVSNTMFIIEKGGKYGLMDMYGKLNTELIYDELSFLDNSLFLTKMKNKYYVIDKMGRAINEEGYAAIEPLYSATFSSGYYYDRYNTTRFTYLRVTSSNGKQGLIDKVGVEVMKPEYDEITGESENRIMIKKGGKLGLYNLYTKTMELPAEYDQLIPDGSMYYAFKGNDLYQIMLGGEVKVSKVE